MESQKGRHRPNWRCQERLDVEPWNTSRRVDRAPDLPRGYSARRILASHEDSKQPSTRDICMSCKPPWRGRDAADTWIWLVTPWRRLSSGMTRETPVRGRLGEHLHGGSPERKRGGHSRLSSMRGPRSQRRGPGHHLKRSEGRAVVVCRFACMVGFWARHHPGTSWGWWATPLIIAVLLIFGKPPVWTHLVVTVFL